MLAIAQYHNHTKPIITAREHLEGIAGRLAAWQANRCAWECTASLVNKKTSNCLTLHIL